MISARQLAMTCTILMTFAGGLCAQHQDHAVPALARIENGTLLIRQFLVDSVPLPGQQVGNRPKIESQEFRLWFHLGHVQAFSPDGKPVAGNP